MGLNTRYRATPQRPVLAFYGEFDNTGRKQLIEAYYEGETLYPLRGRSDSLAAFPSLVEEFPTFQSFAAAALQDIYSPRFLAAAQRFEVNTLESAALLNDGRATSLSVLCRASLKPRRVWRRAHGCRRDGKLDLYLAQNFFSPQPETGRMDGGLSLLLRGNGDGSFTPVWPNESGLVVPGDAKGLVVIDLNNDGWPDFVVGINNGAPVAFENRGLKQNRVMNIRLQGRREIHCHRRSADSHCKMARRRPPR